MRFTDYFTLAFKNIGRQKLRSSLTIFAVVIGATSVTIMLALVTGAKSFFMSQYQSSGTLQQVIVTQSTDLDYDQARFGGRTSNDGVKLNDDLVNKIKSIAHVNAASPSTDVHVFAALSLNDKKLSVQDTKAFEPNGVFKQTMLAGAALNESDDTGHIVLSQAYADKLGFKDNYSKLVGQTVTLVTQNFYTGPGADIAKPPSPGPNQSAPTPPDQSQQKPTNIPAQVMGIVGDGDSGDATIYFPLKWASQLNINQHWEPEQQPQQMQPKPQPGKPNQPMQATQPTYKLVTDSDLDRNGYNTITLMVDSTKNVEKVASSVRTLGVGAVTAKSYVHQQLTVLNLIGAVLGGIGGIALVVAAIGVINTMVMATLERTREIGVMRACGATRRAVRRLFTFEAALLGFLGGVVGLAIGYGMTRIANVLLDDKLSDSTINTSNLITLPLWLILAVLGITTVIGLVAGLYPASRAARLNPVEALRYE